MSKITDEDVLKLAKLSKIRLSQEELSKFRVEIESILGYVEQLQLVNTDELEATNQVTGLENVMRDDKEDTFTPAIDLLKNVPSLEDDYIKVRRVL